MSLDVQCQADVGQFWLLYSSVCVYMCIYILYIFWCNQIISILDWARKECDKTTNNLSKLAKNL